MSADVWIGAAATLTGVGLGGLISLAVSRLQIEDGRRQRAEDALRSKEQRSLDRRFECYAEFLSRSRSYRNGIRSLAEEGRGTADADQLDNLAAAADAASSRVFLVVEESDTYDACRSVVRAIGVAQDLLHREARTVTPSEARELNDGVAGSLRRFQAAARDELRLGGVDRPRILGEYLESEPVPS